MSTNLAWRPVAKSRKFLPKELKFAISKRIWNSDGSCGNGKAIMNANDIEYVEGLRDAKVKGAQELYDILCEYGEIEIWHE